MNIQVHGAIETNNYGDILLAVLFCKKIKLLGHNVIVKGACKEFYDYMGNDVVKEGRPDKVVFCGGGYICDGTLKFTLHMIKTIYIRMAYCRIKKIPYTIIGAGTKTFQCKPTKRFIRWCIEGAEKIYVRNEESKKDLEKIGIKKEINVTTDNVMAISIKNINTIAIEKMKEELKEFELNNKKILLHLNYLNIDGNEKITEGAKILFEAIKIYCNSCKDTDFLICCDHKISMFIQQCKEIKRIIGKNNTKIIICDNIDNMLALISLCDGVITTKLHVGISAVALNKKVASFPMHPKTNRFYRQIHEDSRCKMLTDIKDTNEVLSIIKYSLKKEYNLENIKKIQDEAKKNYAYLEKFIGED